MQQLLYFERVITVYAPACVCPVCSVGAPVCGSVHGSKLPVASLFYQIRRLYFTRVHYYFANIFTNKCTSCYNRRNKTPTYFGSHLPSSRCFYDRGVRANLLFYVLFVIINLIKNYLLRSEGKGSEGK